MKSIMEFPIVKQTTMRSLVVEAPNMLALCERPVPHPGPTEVLIRVAAAAICHTDFVTMAGQHDAARFPSVLGHEFSGVVEMCGEGVSNLRPGDRVTAMGFAYCGMCFACRCGRHTACENIGAIPFHIDGAFQEMLVVPSSMVFLISDSLSFEEAALTEPAANGYAAAERGGIDAGENVVVIGPGPIGLLALQAAAMRQPGSLIMLGTRDERLTLASRFGATDTVNVRRSDPREAVMEITRGKGADVVLFCGGGEETWMLSSRILAPYGRVVVEALPDRCDACWPVPIFDFTARHVSYLGVCGFTGSQFATALRLIEAGKMDVGSLITHRFSLEDYEEAFETSQKRKEGAIKVIFKL
ncbi:MAG: alcohol dehydrogenase catalytic domain-containing protein [Armatimonadetes bacterium]|nr:alcohol dehydrogenase catalytic domain-containing protein [Armatimonadota bacterium]